MWQNKSLFYTIVSEYIIILSTHYIIVFFYSTSVYVLFGPGIYTVKFKHCKMRSLFRSKKFVLDEKLEWNASNFVIFLEYELLFYFFYHFVLSSSFHIYSFSYSKKMANFEAFHCWDHLIKHKPFNSDEWQQHSLCAGKPFYDLSDFYRCEAGRTTNWAALGRHARIK